MRHERQDGGLGFALTGVELVATRAGTLSRASTSVSPGVAPSRVSNAAKSLERYRASKSSGKSALHARVVGDPSAVDRDKPQSTNPRSQRNRVIENGESSISGAAPRTSAPIALPAAGPFIMPDDENPNM